MVFFFTTFHIMISSLLVTIPTMSLFAVLSLAFQVIETFIAALPAAVFARCIASLTDIILTDVTLKNFSAFLTCSFTATIAVRTRGTS